MPPVIIAHRTSPLDAPENSLAGIRRSAELGADYVEIDVRLTRDGVPVMLHDALLLRTTLRPWPVSWATAKGLRRARLRKSGEPVPTFAEAVAALPDGMGFAIDTKAPDAADAVVDELRRQGKLDRSLLWAQSERAVRRYVELAGDEAPEVALLRDAFTPEAIDRFLRRRRRLRGHRHLRPPGHRRRGVHRAGPRARAAGALLVPGPGHPGAPGHAAPRRHRHRLARRRPREEPRRGAG